MDITEKSEIDSHKYTHWFFFLTKVKKQFNGGMIGFSTNNAGAIGQTVGE